MNLSRFVPALPWLLFSIPFLAFAHEVYVLSPDNVTQAVAMPAFSEWDTILDNLNQFLLWGFIAALVVFIVFFVSITRGAEKALDPMLAKLPPYAPMVSRVTIGLSFLFAAYNHALFGPELPLTGTFGPLAPFVTYLLVLLGCMLITGIYARTAAVISLALFAGEIIAHGSYLLTYANYFGELILLLILGAHTIAVHGKSHDTTHLPAWLIKMRRTLAPYSFLILRIAFGTSLLYASLYAKIFHDNLALAVTAKYPAIVSFFGFEPHFLVLGAAVIEIVIALFFILGIEIRFTALFMLFWLSLSLWYFGEAVWPHLILIGIPIAFICYGYDKYSLEGYFFRRGKRQPVL